VTIAIVVGNCPAATVVGSTLIAPVDAFTENPEIVPASSLATYANFPEGSKAIDVGPTPVSNGDPPTARSAPVDALIENTETPCDYTFVDNRPTEKK
jgi:hypothetical protein